LFSSMLGNRNGSTWKSGRERAEAHDGNAEQGGRTSAIALTLLTRGVPGARGKSQGLVCEGRTFVSVCVKSKRTSHSLGTRWSATFAGAKSQCLAA